MTYSGTNGRAARGSARVLIIGLDGASFDYIDPLVEQGRLPNIAKLLRSGARARMRSTYPPISAPAWVTFMTGENPGRHGVYEFWSTDLTQYNPLAGERLISSASYAGKTLFDIVGLNGRVAALRVPVTFPAWDIPGVMVTGYPSPWGAEGTVSPANRSDLARRPRASKADWLTRHRGSQEDMHLSLFREQLELVTAITLDVLEEDSYELFMVVYNQLDAVGHHFPRHGNPLYPTFEPDRSPEYSDVITEFHVRLDEAIGNILSKVKGDPLVLLVSDHGMGPRATSYLQTNAWLESLGYLRTKRDGTRVRQGLSKVTNFLNENLPIRQELRKWFPKWLKTRTTALMFNVDAVDWSATSAYRVRMLAPIEGIEINLQGRQAQGIVSPGTEYEKVRDELLGQLSELREPSTGERLVREVFKREQLYSGPFLEHAPDIVFELRPGYEGGPGVKPPIIRPIPPSFLKMRSGNHTMDGIFVAKGAAARPGIDFGQIGLADVTPTILYYLGHAIPENMDGDVAEAMFVREFAEDHVARRQGSVQTARPDRGDFSEDEEEAMRKQLKALGYL